MSKFIAVVREEPYTLCVSLVNPVNQHQNESHCASAILRIRPMDKNKSFNFSFNSVLRRCVWRDGFLDREVSFTVSSLIKKVVRSTGIAANSD